MKKLFRLFIFSILVTAVFTGLWVVSALAAPQLTHSVSVFAWDSVDYIYAAIGREYTNGGSTDSIALATPPLPPTKEPVISDAISTPVQQTDPGAMDCDVPSSWVSYIVLAEDTLEGIAANAGTTKETLQTANCLPTAEVAAGQMVYLPISAVSPPQETLTLTPEFTGTLVSSLTPTSTASQTKTVKAAPTSIPASTSTSTALPPSPTSPANTTTPTNTPWPTATLTENPTNTQVPTANSTQTATSQATAVNTPTATPTATRTATATVTPSGPAATPTVDLNGCSYNTQSSVENQVLTLLNQERANVGLPPLIMHSQLRGAAREHSADMACNDFVSHTGSNGTSSYDRITGYGYSPSWWGENIYMGWKTTPEEVVNWWMNSEPHRKNILHAYYVHIGIGHVTYGNTVAYTLNFGRP